MVRKYLYLYTGRKFTLCVKFSYFVPTIGSCGWLLDFLESELVVIAQYVLNIVLTELAVFTVEKSGGGLTLIEYAEGATKQRLFSQRLLLPYRYYYYWYVLYTAFLTSVPNWYIFIFLSRTDININLFYRNNWGKPLYTRRRIIFPQNHAI